MLGRYTLGHDVHDEAEIANYVNGQCHGDETVQYVVRIKTEFVTGQRFDAWDVHTDKQRWWVLTNLTNLYPQAHFPGLDYTLSFHIGLMHRKQSRQERERGDREPDPFDEIYRRRDEVADLIVEAIEAEEFQSGAMRLRECLITLSASCGGGSSYLLGESIPRTQTCRAGMRFLSTTSVQASLTRFCANT